MPNIAKIVCGTHGGTGEGGAIKPGIILTLISGSPNAEFSLTVDYYSPFIVPQVKKARIPEHDAALCSMLSAAAALEPEADKSYDHYNEITLDDGTSYRVSYPQLDALISALWRSCSERGLSSKPAPWTGLASPALPAAAGSWNCLACGISGQTGKFCTECGSPRPADAGDP